MNTMEREDKKVHSRDKCFIHWSIMKVGAGRGLCNRSGSWWLMDSQKGNDAMGRNKRKVALKKHLGY